MKKRKGTIWTNSYPNKNLIFATMKNIQLTRKQLSKTFANFATSCGDQLHLGIENEYRRFALRSICMVFAAVDESNPSVGLPVWNGGGHRGEQTDFYPSENLENSSERGKRQKAVPPVECIHYRGLSNAGFMHTYRCELIFILSFTGFPEPSDEECDECSHFFLVRMLIGVVVNDCRDNDRPLSDENNMKKTVIVWHKVFLAAITLSKHKEVEIIPSLSKIKKNEYNEKLLEIITRGALPCRNDRMF